MYDSTFLLVITLDKCSGSFNHVGDLSKTIYAPSISCLVNVKVFSMIRNRKKR